jgi:hypothetical protein
VSADDNNAVAELDVGSTVFRLVRDEERYIPIGSSFPNGEAFAPSSADKSEAQQRGCPIRVSVWDRARSTVAQARAIYQGKVLTVAYALYVRDIAALRVALDRPRLRVVRDELPTDEPGADGHCGIEGLDRLSGESRQATKTLLDELARRAFAIT